MTATSTDSSVGQEPLMTVSDASAALNMSRSWLYEQLLDGTIPGVRLGRAWRIPLSIVEHLRSHGVPTQDATRGKPEPSCCGAERVDDCTCPDGHVCVCFPCRCPAPDQGE